MKKFAFVLLFAAAVSVSAQKSKPKTDNIPAGVPVKQGTEIGSKAEENGGKLDGKTYTNEKYKFEITFPESWGISESDIEDELLKQGIDLRLKAPDAANPQNQANLKKAVDRVKVLLTAYHLNTETKENAILRISVEDLSANPQIKDAVDYFNAMRQTFKLAKLPADFEYSETDAEQLGKKQFAFLDIETSEAKKRMYATVRNGYALMFTLSYKDVSDLQALRDSLANGDFTLKKTN
ncbi:MAG TPA: hypothetical protein PKY59_09080 [Pyrinomonadaceae bacterium]|nr:hypothetical protein [Pyrinomonadaceae bacterium]